MARKGYVSARKAAQMLGVDHKTIKSWVKRGRIPGEVRRVKTVREFIVIPKESLKTAFEVKCRWCGKTFTAKHPGQARYCSRKHKDLYLYNLKKKAKKAGKKGRK